MAYLEITAGENAGKYYQLTKRTLTAGRDPAREIQLIDAKVSRKHFQVRCVDGDYYLVHLKSLNGVYLNGTKIEAECKLEDGAEIVAGQTTLRFHSDDNPDRSNAVHQYRKGDRGLREDRTITD